MSSIGSKASIRGSILLGAALALAGCASSGTGGTGASTGATSPAVTVPASTAAGTPAPPATTAGGGGGGTAQVDLTFTGTYAFTAKGTAGRCILIGTPPKFGFEATEADYPGLGQSYSMAEFNGVVDIKWLKDDATAYGNPMTPAIGISADHRTVTLDLDLSPFTPSGGAAPGPEHVKGTITC